MNETETAQAEPAPTPGRTEARLAANAQTIFRGLWASVFYAPAEPPASVLVCSPAHREGATTVACGLALAGAGEAPHARVGLVDFNIRTPAVHKLMRLPNDAGVSDVLTGRVSLAEALRGVGPGQLDVLTVGSRPEKVLEVLQAGRVKELLKSLSERYDHVVVDAAPANLYPDAQVLASAAGAVVLIARARQTPRESMLAAKGRLERASGRIAGVVLNMRTYPIPKFLYRRV